MKFARTSVVHITKVMGDALCWFEEERMSLVMVSLFLC